MTTSFTKELEYVEKLREHLETLCENNQFNETQSLAARILEKAENLFGKNHPYLIHYLDMLAEMYRRQGLNSESETLHKRSLKIWETAFVSGYGIKDLLSDIFPCQNQARQKIPTHTSEPCSVRLTQDFLLETGDNRECYAIPNDPEKCIKIEKPWNEGLHNRPKNRIKRKVMPWLADFSSNREESRFYLIKGKTLGEDFYKHAPRCYGIVFTNLGPGLVVERIRDYNGEYSERLDKFLEKYPEKVEEVTVLLEELLAYVLEKHLPIFCWNHENLILRRNRDGDELVVIDWKSQGNPNREFPVVYLSSRLQRRKMHKQFTELLLSLAPDPTAT